MKTSWFIRCHVVDVRVLITEKPDREYARVYANIERTLRNHGSSSAFVVHAEEEGHLPDWTGAAVVGQEFTKTQRRIVKAAFIATEMTINTSTGFFRLATAAANLVKKGASHILKKED